MLRPSFQELLNKYRGKCLRAQRLLPQKPHPEMPLRGHAAAVAKLGVTEEPHRPSNEL